MAFNRGEMTMAELLDSTFTSRMNALAAQDKPVNGAPRQAPFPTARPLPAPSEDALSRALRHILGTFGQSPVAPTQAPIPQRRPAPGPIEHNAPGRHTAPPPLFSTRTG